MLIRNATQEDLDAISQVEAECFPPAEAATKEEFAKRLAYYGSHFWLMFDGDKLIAFVDGFVTDEADLTDEMYEKAEMHRENGDWQMFSASIPFRLTEKRATQASSSNGPLRTPESRAEKVWC